GARTTLARRRRDHPGDEARRARVRLVGRPARPRLAPAYARAERRDPRTPRARGRVLAAALVRPTERARVSAARTPLTRSSEAGKESNDDARPKPGPG